MWQFKAKACWFTLVELLVVIAVISVLMSLLLPALKRAKDSANGIVCKNNLKQMGLSLSLYVQDSNDIAPWAVEDASGGYPLWMQQLAIYMDPAFAKVDNVKFVDLESKKAWIFRCPSGPVIENTWQYFLDNYAVNAYFKLNGAYSSNVVRASKVKSSMIIFADANCRSIHINTSVGHEYGYWALYMAFRHSGFANCFYMNGSVSSIARADMRNDKLYPLY